MRHIGALLVVLWLTGCADTAYYWQSVGGHARLMQAAQPIDDWLARSTTPPKLHARLQLAQAMRRFAVTDLHLPDNASYQRFGELQRRYAVWNVVAAPEFSLTLKTWCFPVAGCVGYRGYFDEADAQALVADLRAQGLEASVYGVPAYSTLGWMNWAGGDPLLSTFVHYPDGQLAGLMFHELAHQVLYVPDDTVFNESFATAVERLGAQAWLAQHGTAQVRQAHQQSESRRAQFRALTRITRAQLSEIYIENQPLAQSNKALIAMKNKVMQNFRSAYVELKADWGGYDGYDSWVAKANNAAFGAVAAYDDLVPGFEALFAQEGRSWPRFYDAVRQLARLDAPVRRENLKQIFLKQQGSGATNG
jgi:predicted aminopeptidase